MKLVRVAQMRVFAIVSVALAVAAPACRADDPLRMRLAPKEPRVELQEDSLTIDTALTRDSEGELGPNFGLHAGHNDTSVDLRLIAPGQKGKPVKFDASVTALSLGHVGLRSMHESEYSVGVAGQLAYELNGEESEIDALRAELARAEDSGVKAYLSEKLRGKESLHELRIAQLREEGYGVTRKGGSFEVAPARDEASRRFDFRLATVGGVYRVDPLLATRQYGGRLELASTSFDVGALVLGRNAHLCGSVVPVAVIVGKNEGRGAVESLASVCAGFDTGIGTLDLSVAGRTDWAGAAQLEERLDLKSVRGSRADVYVEHSDESAGGKTVSRNTAGVVYGF